MTNVVALIPARAGSKELGAEVPFLRPECISGDYSTDYDFINHALGWLVSKHQEPEYIVHIRPTTPMRDSKLIDEAVTKFLATPNATALRSVHEMSESAYKTFEISENNLLRRICVDNTELDGSNKVRQQFPKTYQANGYVDVLSTAFIRESKLIHGNQVMPFITPVVIEVDTEDDFSHLEYLIDKNNDIFYELFS